MLKKLIMFAAVAGLALAPAPAARADPLTGPGGVMAPTGAHPVLPRDWGVGDKYHLAFVSSSTHDAVSTDINVYNAWVQSQADAAGSIVKSAGAITWKAICSTSGMDAKDNTNISAPVYLVDPTAPILLAVDAADMWDGNIGHKFDGTETGGTGVGKPYVWTGTQLDGTAQNEGLGGSLPTYYADPRGYGTWVMKTGGDFGDGSSTDEWTLTMRLFAMSAPLTVIPEPASAALLLIGAPLLALRRRRR